MQQSWETERRLAILVPRQAQQLVWGTWESLPLLVGLGGIYVILQAAWKLCGLCINDQMQIVPGGHSLFSQIFTAWHTQGQAGGSVLTI